MNVGTLKTLSYLTSLGLLGGIGYIGYDYYENGQHVRYFDKGVARDILEGVKAPRPPVPLALNYDKDIRPAIVDFDWTGKLPPPPVEVPKGPEGPVEVPKTPVDDILDVVAIIHSNVNPGGSACLLRFAESTKPDERDLWFYVGDSLPAPNDGISVFRIRGDAVVFSFSDEEREKEEVIPASRKGSGVIVKVDDPNAVVAPRGLGVVSAKPNQGPSAPAQTQKKNGQYYLGTEDAENFAQNYDTILSRDVGTKTYFDKDGKRAGIQITSVKEGSIAARHGVQQGDIIISINGTPVSSKQEAISFAKKHADIYEVWEVQVMNLGRIRTEVYHTPSD